MGKVSMLGVWVPHTLSEENKEDCISITTVYPFLKNNITDEEKWLFYDNDERKMQQFDTYESLQITSKVKIRERNAVLLLDNAWLYSAWTAK